MNESNETSVAPETTISPLEAEIKTTIPANSSQKENSQENIAIIQNETSQSKATTSMEPESTISPEIEFQTTIAQSKITQTNIQVVENEGINYRLTKYLLKLNNKKIQKTKMF